MWALKPVPRLMGWLVGLVDFVIVSVSPPVFTFSPPVRRSPPLLWARDLLSSRRRLGEQRRPSPGLRWLRR